MNESATTIDAAAPELPRLRAAAGELDRRLFAAGVAVCTCVVAAFLLVQLDKWPPHEDETLPLFVGRHSLGDLFDIVLRQRGGAPLHFLLAWIVAHTGGGLHEMRLLSALFAIASIPAIAVLGNRLAGRGPALAAVVLASASWILLFHGIYARMYSLFLLLSTLSYLALLHVLRHGGLRLWILWGAVMLLAIAAHQYGALVLASQGLYVVLTRARLRQAVPAFAAVGLLAIPLWRASVVLADRYGVVDGSGRGALSTPHQVFAYLWHAAADSSAGYTGVLVAVLLLALAGLGLLARDRPRNAVLVACAVVTPMLFFLVGKFGGSSAPQSRHLIFLLPFFAIATGCGIVGLSRFAGPYGWVAAVLVVAALVPTEIAWGRHKTPALFGSESAVRVHARDRAADWLAATSRPDDVLFAYDPLYLAAWERHRSAVSNLVLARADAKLLLEGLDDAPKPLGRGVWVFDAGDNNNYVKRTHFDLGDAWTWPGLFEHRVYGPYLIVRTRKPTRTIERYLFQAQLAELLGKGRGMGDADINFAKTCQVINRVRAQRRLPVRSCLSTSS